MVIYLHQVDITWCPPWCETYQPYTHTHTHTHTQRETENERDREGGGE